MLNTSLENIKGRLYQFYRKSKLRNKDFTIISNNCWGGFVYQLFELKYNTPFIGLFLFAPDYIELLNNFNEVINNELIFIKANQSKYKNTLKEYGTYGKYPIGKLNNDIEIHFLHYNTEKEAITKWNERVRRINFDKLLVKFCDRDLCTDELIKEFNNLKFKNKICFTAKEYDYDCTVKLDECEGMQYVEEEWQYYGKYVDIIKILNSL